MSQRIEERLERVEESYRIVNGELIDQFTTVIDRRTTEEILSREPKCVRGNDDKKESRKAEVKEKTAETQSET